MTFLYSHLSKNALSILSVVTVVILFSLPLSGIAEILITSTHVIELSSSCTEETVCNDLTYKGISKKKGASLHLTGRTLHEDCDYDGCDVNGYVFHNRNTRYTVSTDGKLRVTQGDKVLLVQQGVWDYTFVKKEGTPKNFPFVYSPDGKKKITLSKNDNKVSAKLSSGKVLPLITYDEESGAPDRSIYPAILNDFNFDGYLDIAILTHHSMVNDSYVLFLWNPITNRFNDIDSFVNPDTNNDKRFLISSHRSGPRWYSKAYRYNKNKPFTPVFNHEWMIVDENYNKFTFVDSKTKKNKTIITRQHPEKVTSTTPPAEVTVLSKTYLEDTKDDGYVPTKMYLIKGDRVKLLDYDEMRNKFFVQYTGKKIIKKWIDFAALDLN